MEYSSPNEQAQRICSEFEQAIRWRRSAIIIVTCSSAAARKTVQNAMAIQLQTLKQTISTYTVSPATYDIPLTLAQHPQRNTTIFYVTHLNRGGGVKNKNAFYALNMRRELLIDHPTRVVFWLTRGEAKALALLSPDFWAFRHVSIEI